MKAYSIVLSNNEVSERGYSILTESSRLAGNTFHINKFPAITADQANRVLQEENITWKYPLTGAPVLDIATGLVKSPYTGVDFNKRIACALSHYILWKKAREGTIIVLEHDAKFIYKLDFNIEDTGFEILGINNPIGATRRSSMYHDAVQKSDRKYQVVPYIDNTNVPQGLAGNSAYIITPEGANKMLDLVQQYGLWPNDALMCVQLYGPKLGVTKRYYTTVQGLPSTTSL